MELVRTLGVLCEAPAPEHETIASALGIPAPDPEEWTRLFVLELPPYASIYLDAEGMIGGEARERVAGFWRALALAPPAEPDHLASLLGLYTALAEAERDEPDPARRALWREARTAFLWEHLASWLPLYLDALEALAGNGYAAWAGLLQDALAGEAARLSPPAGLPAQLRAAPALIVGGETGIDELVGVLLVPVRTGLVLAPADLRRAAHELELGSRLGERRTVLRTLLAQEPARTLGWLAAEAQRRAVRPAPFWFEREISRFWTERAEAAAALLSALGEEAARQEVSHVG
jgi:hypothetical protein